MKNLVISFDNNINFRVLTSFMNSLKVMPKSLRQRMILKRNKLEESNVIAEFSNNKDKNKVLEILSSKIYKKDQTKYVKRTTKLTQRFDGSYLHDVLRQLKKSKIKPAKIWWDFDILLNSGNYSFVTFPYMIYLEFECLEDKIQYMIYWHMRARDDEE